MLNILILADNRPGHYHLADGIAAALGRRADCEVSRVTVARRRGLTNGVLRSMLGWLSPTSLLRLGYSLDEKTLPAADLVVSAGGDTLIANLAVAKARGCPNVFCGTLRAVPDGSVTLVVSSYAEHAERADHLVTLKPSSVDPVALGRPDVIPTFSESNPPTTIGLLIGGPSGLFAYDNDEWQQLRQAVTAVHAAWGTRWVVSTSRRTPDAVADDLARLSDDPQAGIAEFIDYRTAGPGTLIHVFANADAIVCTEDSSTMISEAISARLPVVGVSPRAHSFKPEEAGYRTLMENNNWCRFLPLADLTPERLGSALVTLTPIDRPPLEHLANQLADRLGPNLPPGTFHPL